jgi:hypothetical protein
MLKVSGGAVPSMARDLVFRAGLMATFARLLVWLYASIRFLLGTLTMKLRGRDTIETRAERLRLTLERMGPTFVKLGQQLAMRPDVLPFAYCAEMSKMLDKVPAYPVEQAIATIERSLGKKLGELFAVLDPNPIGSASRARSGEVGRIDRMTDPHDVSLVIECCHATDSSRGTRVARALPRRGDRRVAVRHRGEASRLVGRAHPVALPRDGA